MLEPNGGEQGHKRVIVIQVDQLKEQEQATWDLTKATFWAHPPQIVRGPWFPFVKTSKLHANQKMISVYLIKNLVLLSRL